MGDPSLPSIRSRFNPGDVWGGLSASALLLPQAMAFGIALWLPVTGDAAGAALSGLVTAVWLCLASGLLRGTEGMVSAPTGPTLVLMTGAVATLAASGLQGDMLVTGLCLVLLLAGVVQALIGVFQLGHLIKFIPYPVVSGFMVGTGILMVLSQWGPATGEGVDALWQPWVWIPMLTTLITFAAIMLLPRYVPVIPGTVMGLLVGTAAFHLLCLLGEGDIPVAWVVGQLPPLQDLRLGLPVWPAADFPWPIILTTALALAVLASLDSLLTSMVADVATGERHHARRELMGQGLGHVLAGLLGGMAGAGTTGATLVAIRSGGRRWVAMFTGLFFVLLILFLAPVASLLPISVFAGIILHVAIIGMLNREGLVWLSDKRARFDGATSLLVIAITVFYDLMTAVAVGVVLAVIEFIRYQTKSSIVHERWTLDQKRSLRRRTGKEQALLTEHPEAIVTYELTGMLFFGTADRLLDAMKQDLERPCTMVIDMRRVMGIDLTAQYMLDQVISMAEKHGGRLLLAHVPKAISARKKQAAKRKHGRFSLLQLPPLRAAIFQDTDEALEVAENDLLESYGSLVHVQPDEVPLRAFEILSDLNDSELSFFETLLTRCSLEEGHYLFHAGDHGESLYFVLRGEMDLHLAYRKKQRIRLAKFGAGTIFGEVSMLEPGPRTSDALALTHVEMLELSQKGLKKLKKEAPQTAIKLLTAMGRESSHHLRWTMRELRHFAR